MPRLPWRPGALGFRRALLQLLFVWALFGGCLLIFGQDANSASTLTYLRARQRPPGVAARPAWVWEIQGAHAKVWLVGCLHLGKPEDTSAFAAYLPYYREAGTVVFETLPGSWNTYEIRRLLDQRGYLQDRRTLSSVVSRSTWEKVSAVQRSRRSTLQGTAAMTPWLAAFSIVQDGYARAGLRAEDSLEGYMERAAIADGKPVGALETAKDQILAMADASAADQEEFLKNTLESLDRLDTSTEALRSAWVNGNESRLRTALGIDPSLARSGMHLNLIANRNSRWVARIKELANRKTNSFVLVGVEHLVSPPALPDLLQQSGLKIQRLEAGK